MDARLKAAKAAGWNDAEHMTKKADLERLRELPEFKAMIEGLRNKRNSS